jgi:hypothetical protein
MATATITIHLPAYRQRALRLQSDPHEAEPVYDGNIGDYIRYLKDEATKAGYTLVTDESDQGHAYSMEAGDHDAKKAAHDWLDTLPDIWNWIP